MNSPTVFYQYGSDQPLYTDDSGLYALANGAGVVLPDGSRYRVVASWLSFATDALGPGMHIYLEPEQNDSGADAFFVD